jgi:transcriptional regulator
VYIPRHFAVEDQETLYGVMRENSFATLITAGDGEPFATHLPLLVEDGMLIGHMAKANPHWKLFDGRGALAIFQGPHAYVSPRLYVTSPNVPTWNYITVHAYGKPDVIEDSDEAATVLYKSMALYDPTMQLDGAFHEYLQKQLPGIVAFTMPIDRLEGKFKLNQNKKPEDRKAVIEKLSSSSDPLELEVAKAMRDLYTQRAD